MQRLRLQNLSRGLIAFTAMVGYAELVPAQQAADRRAENSQLPADLALVPSDALQLLAFNLGKPWNGVEAESLGRVSSSHPMIPSWHMKDLPKTLGIEPSNIQRMMQLSFPDGQPAVVTTIEPYDREKVLAAFVPQGAEKSAGDKTYFHSGTSSNSIYFLNERTMVLGLGQDLQTFLARPTPPDRDPTLDAALMAAKNGAPFVVHAGPAVVGAMSNDLRLNDGEFAPLAKAKAWRIVAEADAGLRIKLLADFANEKDATDSKAALQLIGEKLTALMPFYKENMIPFLNQQQAEHPGAGELATKMTGAIDAASQALKAMEVRSRGNLAGAQIFIKTEEPLTTAVLLLTLTPRAGVE